MSTSNPAVNRLTGKQEARHLHSPWESSGTFVPPSSYCKLFLQSLSAEKLSSCGFPFLLNCHCCEIKQIFALSVPVRRYWWLNDVRQELVWDKYGLLWGTNHHLTLATDSLAGAAIGLSLHPSELSIVVTKKYRQQQIEIHQAHQPCSLKSIFNFRASVMAVAGYGMLGSRIT